MKTVANLDLASFCFLLLVIHLVFQSRVKIEELDRTSH